jgi:hypothetical protein
MQCTYGLGKKKVNLIFPLANLGLQNTRKTIIQLENDTSNSAVARVKVAML